MQNLQNDNNSLSLINHEAQNAPTPIAHENPLKSIAKCDSVVYITQPQKASEQIPPKIFGIETSSLTVGGSLFTAFVSALVAYKTIKKYSKDYKLQLDQIKFSQQGKKVEKAKYKIETFFGPLHALLEESRVIYEHFALVEKHNLKSKGSYFRTLRYLTHEDNRANKKDNLILKVLDTLTKDKSKQYHGLTVFEPHDQELLKHILNISDKIISLIEDNSGHVDNPALHILLGKLAAHYRIIKSASEGKLTGQANFLESIVFPLEINGAIYSEICKLNLIIKQELAEKVEINKTIKFYNENYLDYYHQTIDTSGMQFIYEQVRKVVPNGSEILDAGCGVGRDTKYFIKHGFKVTSFDASEKMVEMCNEYPFAFCEHKSFKTISYPPIFDLVWACASLLHINKKELLSALTKLHRSLKPGGIIYFSLKSGIDKSKITDRDFYSYDYCEITEILESNLNMEHINSWSNFSAITSTEKFINYIYKK
ncbi:methyltransferase domain-containing protein [Pseudoalteromonas shioyasakiensis]|uniref:class I SAM-dependent methyltransferase n=1 Tax=Pseudoalteromonas shioyasakiensis TaxID=1190813 RepID=UPI0020953EF1|nr:class I SAM-dependent methyltransferase [Pseudoalteromonas shioyasakiensis]MCO6356272.1 methyltransferase domain-containing protein [Pseudoalteromonas shioyasakiensis]